MVKAFSTLRTTAESLIGESIWDKFPEAVGSVTDVVMPGMNGPQLAVEAHKLYPSVKLLSKPYRRQDLANKIREALDD